MKADAERWLRVSELLLVARAALRTEKLLKARRHGSSGNRQSLCLSACLFLAFEYTHIYALSASSKVIQGEPQSKCTIKVRVRDARDQPDQPCKTFIAQERHSFPNAVYSTKPGLHDFQCATTVRHTSDSLALHKL